MRSSSLSKSNEIPSADSCPRNQCPNFWTRFHGKDKLSLTVNHFPLRWSQSCNRNNDESWKLQTRLTPSFIRTPLSETTKTYASSSPKRGARSIRMSVSSPHTIHSILTRLSICSQRSLFDQRILIRMVKHRRFRSDDCSKRSRHSTNPTQCSTKLALRRRSLFSRWSLLRVRSETLCLTNTCNLTKVPHLEITNYLRSIHLKPYLIAPFTECPERLELETHENSDPLTEIDTFKSRKQWCENSRGSESRTAKQRSRIRMCQKNKTNYET